MTGWEKRQGFSILEVTALTSVISLLLLVAVPSYMTYRTHNQASCVARMFRTYAAAFNHYAEENGNWPSTFSLGHIPKGMGSLLPHFFEESDIGGHWEWEYNATVHRGRISLVKCEDKVEVLERIDHILDDGNLKTGSMVYADNRISLILQPR